MLGSLLLMGGEVWLREESGNHPAASVPEILRQVHCCAGPVVQYQAMYTIFLMGDGQSYLHSAFQCV